MGRRLDLDAVLRSCINNDNVYFQPPPNLTMQYPCIVYSRDQAQSLFADNIPWRHTKRYQVTIMDRDPDSVIPEKIAALPMSSFSRHYTLEGLHHDIYSLYY